MTMAFPNARRYALMISTLAMALLALASCGHPAESEPLPPASQQATLPEPPEPAIDIDAVIADLRSKNAEAFVNAIYTLAKAPKATRANLPALLAEAKAATEKPEGLYANRISRKTWWSTSSKGALLLGPIADAIRKCTDEKERTQALATFKPFVDEALQGKVPGVSPCTVLDAYYYCVFEPPQLPVSPVETPAIDDIFLTLRTCLKDPNTIVQRVALSLLEDAAHMSPERSKEVFGIIASELGEEEADHAKQRLDELLANEWTPVPRAKYLEIQRKSEEELVYVLVNDTEGRYERVLCAKALRARLRSSPNRTEIALQFLDKLGDSVYNPGPMISEPILSDASEADKRYADAIIQCVEAKIAEAPADGGRAYERYPRTLAELLAADWLNLETDVRQGAEVPTPYAQDRILAMIGKALQSKNTMMQEGAAYVLGEVAWMSEATAQSALAILTPLSGQSGDIDAAIGRARTALAFYQKKLSSTGGGATPAGTASTTGTAAVPGSTAQPVPAGR